eukprot:TRINITY_DN11428_c0_g1_i1.p1 TRINITY_DN11428_c0_g1~~TRINITY_DN11428_c0_g1_i1.p1  ORF type:complete len:135 (+),score=44.74 TRINITY_DN11428_c0_g1_i1:42-407(+)
MGCKSVKEKSALEEKRPVRPKGKGAGGAGHTPPFVMGYDDEALREFEEEFKKEQRMASERETAEKKKTEDREAEAAAEREREDARKEENYAQFEKEAEEERKALEADLTEGRIQQDYLKLG